VIQGEEKFKMRIHDKIQKLEEKVLKKVQENYKSI